MFWLKTFSVDHYLKVKKPDSSCSGFLGRRHEITQPLGGMSGAACASLLGTRARSYFAWVWVTGALSPPLTQKMTAAAPLMPLLPPPPLLLSLPPLVAAERQLREAAPSG